MSPAFFAGRPEDRLPGDEYLMGQIVMTRSCGDCSRPTTHRQVYDSEWGTPALACWRCGMTKPCSVIPDPFRPKR